MAADDPIGLVEGLRKLGPRWGPLAGVLLLCAGVIWYRWQLGYRAIQDFARDPLLSSVLVVAGAGAATFYYLHGLPRDFAPGEIGILVAPVPGDMHRAEQNSYINVIRALVSNDATLAGFVKVRLLRR